MYPRVLGYKRRSGIKDVDIMEFRVYIEDVSIIGNVFGHSVLNQVGTIYITPSQTSKQVALIRGFMKG